MLQPEEKGEIELANEGVIISQKRGGRRPIGELDRYGKLTLRVSTKKKEREREKRRTLVDARHLALRRQGKREVFSVTR